MTRNPKPRAARKLAPDATGIGKAARIDGLIAMPSRKQTLFILLFLMVIAFSLRVYRLDYCALHNDEALQLNGIQTESMDALIQHCTSVDMHPPLSYLVQKVVYRFNHSRGALRMPSVVLGTLSVPAVFWALIPMLNRRRALIAASLVASSYLLIWFSRELRDYMFFFFLVTMAFGFFVRMIQSRGAFPRWSHVAGFVVFNILATYSHFNTFLTWPVYGVLYLGWDLLYHREIRWRFAVVFTVAGIVILASVFPTMVWASKMRDVQGHDALRPGLVQLYEATAAFGLGKGAFYAVWSALIVLGIYQLLVRDAKREWLALGWVVIPVVAYLYVYGVPAKFVVNLYRYMIILELGLLAIIASGIDGVAMLVGRWHRRAGTALCALSPILFFLVLAPAFGRYYSMRSCGHLFDDLQDHLQTLEARPMILDNYYEMQYLKHYLPPGIRIAHPPVWNNEQEFLQTRAAEFVRRSALEEPLMAFYDSQASRMSPAGEWDWVDRHFKHHREFMNDDAKYLYERGLNLFPILFRDWGMQKISVHHSERADLEAWFAARGMPLQAVFGTHWDHFTVRDLSGAWLHWRVTGRMGTLFLYNKAMVDRTAALTLRVHGCVSGQRVTLSRPDKTVLGRYALQNGPPDGVDLRSGQRFKQYVPLGALSQTPNGMANIPVALQLGFDEIRIEQLIVAPGVSEVVVECAAPEGIVLGSVAIAPAP